MYRYTHEGEWMISSSPAWLLQSWNVIKMWTEDNTEQDWIKKKVKSLFEIPSLNPLIQNVQMEKMISLLVFFVFSFFFLLYYSCIIPGSLGKLLTQLSKLMHFPVLGTLPQTISPKPNWPKKHWFYNTQTNKNLAVMNHQQVSPETTVLKDLCYYSHS